MVIFDLEHLENVNEGNLVVGGDVPGFQLVIGATAAVTGAAAGGRIENSSQSVFTLIAGLGNPSIPINISVLGTATSTSFPS